MRKCHLINKCIVHKYTAHYRKLPQINSSWKPNYYTQNNELVRGRVASPSLDILQEGMSCCRDRLQGHAASWASAVTAEPNGLITVCHVSSIGRHRDAIIRVILHMIKHLCVVMPGKNILCLAPVLDTEK